MWSAGTFFDTIVLNHVSCGDEVGEGTDWRTELSKVELRGTGCRDTQGWGLDLRATVLDYIKVYLA